MPQELILESHFKTYKKEIQKIATEFMQTFANEIAEKYFLKLKARYPFIKTKQDLILAYIAYKSKSTFRNKSLKNSIIFKKGFKIKYKKFDFNIKVQFKLQAPGILTREEGGYLTKSNINISKKWPVIEVFIPRIKELTEDSLINSRYRVNDIKQTLVHEIAHGIDDNIFANIRMPKSINEIKEKLGLNFITYYLNSNEISAKLAETYYQYRQHQKGFTDFKYSRGILTGNIKKPGLVDDIIKNNKIYPREFEFSNILARIIFKDISELSKEKDLVFLDEIAAILSNVPIKFFILKYFMTVALPKSKYFNLVKHDKDYIMFNRKYSSNEILEIIKYITAAINFYAENQNKDNFDKEEAINYLSLSKNIFNSVNDAKEFYYDIKDCLY